MTSPENLLSRWARLKRSSGLRRGTEVADDRARVSAAEISAPADAAAAAKPETTVADDALFDPGSLPSIDAIGVDTDIRAFLQSRVPVELTRAALRQAWASDPAIRDFIGIAENQWDFNGPAAVPGFGPLPEGYDVSGLLSQVLGSRDRLAEKTPEVSASVQQSLPAVTDREPGDAGLAGPRPGDDEFRDEFRSLPDDRSGEGATPENNRGAEAGDRRPNHRRHGSALPRLDGG
jgi:hypothetical protein